MHGFWAVFKRELKSYFTTPLAYVFLVVFLAVSGHMAFKRGFFEARQADMQAFFLDLPLVFFLIVPATAMRLWAEERKTGSIELLLTLPITVVQAILGKFFAAWIFLGIALALTFPMVITVSYLGSPDVGPIITGYLGSWLMAGGFLAIGCFFSTITKNQVIAFVLSVVACAVLVYSDDPTTIRFMSGLIPPFLARYVMPAIATVSAIVSVSFRVHFEATLRGLLQFKDLAYFVLLMIGWLAASMIVLDERKAS